MSVTTRGERFEAFAASHGYVVETALTCYIGDMRKTAATTDSRLAAPFTEAADRGQTALDAWTALADEEEL